METISDSYMVVSGLPRRNGNQHVGQIANLALDLMSAAFHYRINHRPGQPLMLRVGFHTGPCAAGMNLDMKGQTLKFTGCSSHIQLQPAVMNFDVSPNTYIN